MNKKIKITNKTKFFVLTPANTSTGGPECLHELAYHIKKIFKVECFMFYLPIKNKNPVHKNYLHFNLKNINFIEDRSDNILIIPEQYSYLSFSLKFKNIKKIIWWLSLDNYFGFKFREEYSKIIRSIIKLPYNIISIFNFLLNYRFGIYTYHDYLKTIYNFRNIENQKEIKQAAAHLMQSYYVYDYFKNKLKNKFLLYDYQSENILKYSKKKIKNKKNLICYSHKSNKFINILRKKIDAKFIILQGYSKKQIINIFKKTKVYMDFGYHPGKDKMPREAVLLGNCIITNLKGSARNNKDIPIKKEFKFKERYKNIIYIEKIINKIFNSYEKEFSLFKNYRSKTINEKKLFISQINKIFKKKV